MFLTIQKRERVQVGIILCRWKAHAHFPKCCQLKLFQHLKRFSHKSTKHNEGNCDFRWMGYFNAK